MVYFTPSYLTKARPHVARRCQREAAAKAGKVTWPYAAERWQGAAATWATASCALSTAADAAALRCSSFLVQTRAVAQ